MEWATPIAAYLPLGANAALAANQVLSDLGDQCQAAIERTIGRTFENQTYCEIYDGDGRPFLYLDHDPIVSIASVSDSGTQLTIQTQPLNPSSPPTFPLNTVIIRRGGQAIQRTDGWGFSYGTQNIIVTYTAGLQGPGGDIPKDLITATVQWAARLYKQRDRLGEKSRTVGDQLTTFSEDIPADIDRMIDSWQRAFLP